MSILMLPFLYTVVVLHGESSQRQAQTTQDRDHLESAQTTANRHNSQTKHQASSKGHSES